MDDLLNCFIGLHTASILIQQFKKWSSYTLFLEPIMIGAYIVFIIKSIQLYAP